MQFLPTKDIQSCKNELIVARDILEIAVEFSVASKDIPAFERYMSQLKCYYYDYRCVLKIALSFLFVIFVDDYDYIILSYSAYMPESVNMFKLLGLNLLFLLSVNRLSEFHTELELFSADIIQSNEFIRPILALEQYIMEGRYNKIFQAKVNSKQFSFY